MHRAFVFVILAMCATLVNAVTFPYPETDLANLSDYVTNSTEMAYVAARISPRLDAVVVEVSDGLGTSYTMYPCVGNCTSALNEVTQAMTVPEAERGSIFDGNHSSRFLGGPVSRCMVRLIGGCYMLSSGSARRWAKVEALGAASNWQNYPTLTFTFVGQLKGVYWCAAWFPGGKRRAEITFDDLYSEWSLYRSHDRDVIDAFSSSHTITCS